MSPNVATLVPVLKGASNWQSWEASMKAYLLSIDVWWTCVEVPTLPSYPKKTVTVDETTTTEENTSKPMENKEDFLAWKSDNSNAVGSITLCVDPTIQFRVKDIKDAYDLWKELKSEYGKPGLAATFHEFKSTVQITIPDNSDPSLALNRLKNNFMRLYDAGCAVPDTIQCLLLLSKLPPSMSNLAQLICQRDDIKLLNYDAIS